MHSVKERNWKEGTERMRGQEDDDVLENVSIGTAEHKVTAPLPLPPSFSLSFSRSLSM